MMQRLLSVLILLAAIWWISQRPMGWMTLYPRVWGSRLAGHFASLPLPHVLREPALGLFVNHYQVNVDEAEKKLVEYPSLQDFFTRKLKPGLRPQEAPAPGYLNSPVDGTILSEGRIYQGALFQAKGKPYTLGELLLNESNLQVFEGGSFMTLYLAPYNYHRFHMPCEAQVTSLRALDGDLWPVNEKAVSHVDQLYVKNKRSVLRLKTAEGLEIALVFVGATHVGHIRILPEWQQASDRQAKAGDEIGQFEFGSTVVVLIGGSGASKWRAHRTSGPIKVGQRLGARTL
jgi:phosphatidylserine decarboxylase